MLRMVKLLLVAGSFTVAVGRKLTENIQSVMQRRYFALR